MMDEDYQEVYPLGLVSSRSAGSYADYEDLRSERLPVSGSLFSKDLAAGYFYAPCLTASMNCWSSGEPIKPASGSDSHCGPPLSPATTHFLIQRRQLPRLIYESPMGYGRDQFASRMLFNPLWPSRPCAVCLFR